MEDWVCSSDSSLFGRTRYMYGSGVDDEVVLQLSRRGGGLAGAGPLRLQGEPPGRGARRGFGKCSRAQEPVDYSLHVASISAVSLICFSSSCKFNYTNTNFYNA